MFNEGLAIAFSLDPDSPVDSWASFVANSGHRRYYIQSAFMIPDDEKREQETRPLKKISDSFRKIIVMYGNQRPYHNDDGFLIVSLQDFLKGPEVLDL